MDVNTITPNTGRAIKEDNSVVNLADLIEAVKLALVDNKNAGMQLSGRITQYQRVLVNQAIAGNGAISQQINLGGLGTKAISISFRASAAVSVLIQGADNSGSMTSGTALASSPSGNSASMILAEYGGSPYVYLYVQDKSGSANTVTFVDIWWSKG